MRKAACILWAVTAMSFGAVAHGQTTCVGDCSDMGEVTVSDMIVGVNIVLGNQPASKCPAFQNNNGQVNVAQLIKGVNNLLNGCGGTGPTPTPTPTTGGTTRTYQIDCGVLLADTSGSLSGLFNSGLSGANAATMFPPGPLTFVLGAPDSNGIANFTLRDNITLDIGIVDGSRFCLKFDASTSHGSIDCNGGTPYDIDATRPSQAPGYAFTFQTGLGDPAPAGNGNLIVTALFQIVPTGDTTPCDQVNYTAPPVDFAFTTTQGTATIMDTSLTLTVGGQPFSCANFGTPGSGGLLAAPLPANIAPIGNVVASLRFGEIPPGSACP